LNYLETNNVIKYLDITYSMLKNENLHFELFSSLKKNKTIEELLIYCYFNNDFINLLFEYIDNNIFIKKLLLFNFNNNIDYFKNYFYEENSYVNILSKNFKLNSFSIYGMHKKLDLFNEITHRNKNLTKNNFLIFLTHFDTNIFYHFRFDNIIFNNKFKTI
jgi:hypothetical protein